MTTLHVYRKPLHSSLIGDAEVALEGVKLDLLARGEAVSYVGWTRSKDDPRELDLVVHRASPPAPDDAWWGQWTAAGMVQRRESGAYRRTWTSPEHDARVERAREAMRAGGGRAPR